MEIPAGIAAHTTDMIRGALPPMQDRLFGVEVIRKKVILIGDEIEDMYIFIKYKKIYGKRITDFLFNGLNEVEPYTISLNYH